MPLDFQLAAVKFTSGLDTKTQAKFVIPSKWNKLDNLTLSADETPRRRDGVTNLVAGRTGNGLATWNSQMLAVSGHDLYSVVKANSSAVQASGRYGFPTVSKREVQRSVGMQDSCDVAIGPITINQTATNLTCYVWRNKTGGAVVTGLNVSLFDETTGAVIIANQVLRAGTGVTCPRVVYCPNNPMSAAGGTFYIFYIDGTSLYCRTILTSSPTVLNAEVALITDVNLATGVNFDACSNGTVASGNSTAHVTYGWADGTTSVRVIKVTNTAGVPAISGVFANVIPEATLAIANLVGLAIVPFTTSNAGIFAYGFGGSAQAVVSGLIVSGVGTVPIGPTVNGQCHVCGVARADGRVQVFYDQRSNWATNASSPIFSIIFNSTGSVYQGPGYIIYSADFSGGAPTDPAGPRGPYISGKPFPSGIGNEVLLPVEILENYGLTPRDNNNQQNCCFLLSVVDPLDEALTTTTGVVVAHALYGSVGVAEINSNPPRVSTPCSTPSNGTSYAYACTEHTLISVAGSQVVSPTGVVRLSFTPNQTVAPIKTQLGESTYLSGGFVSNYDGLRINEHPFLLFPEGIDVEVVAGGGMTVGVHQIVAIYEYVDNAGQRHQSAPSLAVTGTTAGGNLTLRVRVPTLHMTQLGTGLNIVLYCTAAGGLVLNRVGSTAAGAAGTPNNPAVASVTIDITVPDATLALNEILYNQPNLSNTTLPNLNPPPCDFVWAHQKRLFFNQADQPGTVGYSQQYANNLGLQFNPALQLTWPLGVGGDFKAGIGMDEKNIVFTSRKIYVSYGTGPNAAGGYSNYSDLQEIPGDVGCSDPRSVILLPLGIVFKSAKGFYLLGRDLTVNYIGDGVSAFDSYTITSAVLLEDRQEVRFGTNSSAHPELVFSYMGEGVWSTNSYLDTYVTIDALWWPAQGQYVAIDATYGIQTDTTSRYDNFAGASKAIYWTARTSFLHLAEIGGFQRVRKAFLTGTAQAVVMGNYPASDLLWSVYLNDAYTTAAYSFTVDMSLIAFPSPLDAVDMWHKVEQQKCKSIAFQWSDQPSTAEAVAGSQLDGIQALTLEVGLRKGTLRLPAAQGVS